MIDACLFRPRRAAALALLLVLQACAPKPAAIADACPVLPADHAPDAGKPLNLDTVKKALRAYHDGPLYGQDLAAVFDVARTYVSGRSARVARPAVVLDIDETSLSNWPVYDADDFGYFPKAANCIIPSSEACGFNKWVEQARATPIPPAVAFFNDMRARNVAVFFITGRRDSQRAVTIANLQTAGFEGWTKLDTRPNDDTGSSAVPYKSSRRQAIEQEGYRILASIGDQQSDLDGGSAECGFKLPNPFYFIP